MDAAQLTVIGAGVLIAGAAVAALAGSRRGAVGPVSFLFTLAAAALVFPAALSVLVSNQTATAEALLRVPTIGAVLDIRIDPLSALFLLIISTISVLATLYSVRYMERYSQEHLLRYYPLLLLFYAGIVGVVSVADWFFFLVFWEWMTICSYFLVIFEKGNATALRAGLKYVVMTHAATALILIAVIALWNSSQPHSFAFGAAKQAMGTLAATKPVLLHVVLALWFIGFGTKAGVLPFGDWLPDAYPAAPTAAAAVFGGSMTKLGVYGLLRVFLEMLPASGYSQVWGIVIAVFGAGSIFVGTLTALAQDDAKRLMSFHVIGQIGYMLLAIGTGIYLLPVQPTLALVAIMAGVFHLVNNVCYKSLLFLNAGSLLLRTGETNLNRMSGMWRLMPVTGVTALIASLSIAGLPPFNGFASKWMIYQVTILGVPRLPVFLLLGIVALFVSLVTLASFLKFLGAAFLGPTAVGDEAIAGVDVPLSMQVPQVVLSLLCVGFGLVPMLPLAGIHRAMGALGAFGPVPNLGSLLGESWFGLRMSVFGNQPTGVWLPMAGLTALVLATALSYGISRLGAAARRRVDVWHCGAQLDGVRARYVVVEPRHEPATAAFEARYAAHGLYGAFKEAFSAIYPTFPVPRVPYPRRLMNAFDAESWLFQPLVRAGAWLTQRFSRAHSGVPQQYLAWQLIGLIVVVLSLYFLMR